VTRRILCGLLVALTVASLLGSQAPAASSAKVVQVSVRGPEGSPELQVRTTGPVRYRLVNAPEKAPEVVTVEILGAVLGLPAGALPFRHPLFDEVRLTQSGPSTVLLLVRLKQPRAVVVRPTQDPTGLTVAFPDLTAGGAANPIVGLRVVPGNQLVRVEVEAAGPFTAREVTWSGKPATLVVADLIGVELPRGSVRMEGVGPVQAVRVGQQGPGVVRLAVELTHPTSVQLEWGPNRSRLAVVVRGQVPADAREVRVAQLADARGTQAPSRTQEKQQTAQVPPAAPPGGPSRECVGDLRPPAPPAVPDSRRFTLTFVDERLSVILTAVARVTGVNIVVAPEAGEKRLTIRLLNVTLREALDLLTQPLGLGYVVSERNVVVLPTDRLPGEQAVVCHYRLRYASAEEVAKIITPLLFGERLAPPAPVVVQVPTAPGATPAPSPPPAAAPVVVRTQVAVDKATNSLVVVASRADQERVWEILRRLDLPEARPTPAPERVTRVYRLQWIFADERPRAGAEADTVLAPVGPKDLGEALVEMIRSHTGLRKEDVTFDYRQNSLVVTATEEQHRTIQGLLRQIDVPGEQLLLEASVLDINLSDLKDLGVEWSNILTLPFDELPTNPGQILFNPITRGPLSFQAVIRLLLEQNRARVMANPRVVTRDGQPASVLVGDRIEITLPGVGPQGQATAVTRTIEVGVRLNITPKINPEGDITLRILTDVSSLAAPPTPNLVHIRTRQAATTLRVQEGSPIVLAGLIQNEERRRVVKVPVLGDIPVIGSLFRSERTEQVNTEIVFVITPRRLPRVLAPPTPAPSPSPTPPAP
jgi:type II secretory pathway component GspD/PulD (secretin)